MDALHTDGLEKTYRGFLQREGQRALNGVSLSVPSGCAFGLIGPNGAGKTTFIKILLGIVRPNKGSVQLLGGRPEDPRIRARIGYLPERLHLPGALRAQQVLQGVCRLKGHAPAKNELTSLLDRVGLSGVERPVRTYSKGMRQRLGLASALLGRPELLILDEPTDGIDPLGRIEVRNILSEELKRGTTLFLNSHLLSETERICDRVGILGRGKLLREGVLAELRTAEVVWRVRFAPGANLEALLAAGFSATSTQDLFHCGADSVDALNAALDAARGSGARLVELTREERDLESLLAETVEAA